MTTNTKHKPLTHLELLRKYKTFTAIPSGELRKAQVYLNGQNGIAAIIEASKSYKKELEAEAQQTGMHPAVCFDKDGLCEDDHCRCWK